MLQLTPTLCLAFILCNSFFNACLVLLIGYSLVGAIPPGEDALTPGEQYKSLVFSFDGYIFLKTSEKEHIASRTYQGDSVIYSTKEYPSLMLQFTPTLCLAFISCNSFFNSCLVLLIGYSLVGAIPPGQDVLKDSS